jgi:CheY-like chemotaxis protein
MNLLALLVSSDAPASEILCRVLPPSGIAVERFSDTSTALDRLLQQRFDALIVDFDDPHAADEILQQARKLNSGNVPVTIALVAADVKVRDVLSTGAHFVLHKPFFEENAKTSLRAAIALLKRERRRAHRVPVQAPVELTSGDGRQIEGILLDLSETGLEVLTAEPQASAAVLSFHFHLPDGSLEVEAQGEVAWSQPNGETGVRFVEMSESTKEQLKAWVQAASGGSVDPADESVSHCKLTDLSIGGCYVESESPFPEKALVDLCVRTGDLAVHTEGMVRVTHPGFGMGVEFPSRTPEQRSQVGNLITFLQNCPTSAPELSVSPRALRADLSQFVQPQGQDGGAHGSTDDLPDPLLELIRRGSGLQQEEFLSELRCQRSA